MCTAICFNDVDGKMYFGRNLDWSEGYGQKVAITPRNYKYKTAFLGETKVRYAVIGMAVVEQEVPLYFDCANEAGLAVAGLNFTEYTQYETAAVEGKTNIAAYELPLWIAMNFATVDEVKEALNRVAIVGKALNDSFTVSELHWMVSDATQTIVIERTRDGLCVYETETKVLTNQPTYDWHRVNLRNYLNIETDKPELVKWGKEELRPFGTGAMMVGLPGDYTSPSRFVRAAYFNTHYPVVGGEVANVMRLFHILGGVEMMDGMAAMADGKFEKTIYTSGYAAATQTYYYKNYDDLTIHKVALSDYDLDGEELLVE